MYVAFITNSQNFEGLRLAFGETYFGYRINPLWIPIGVWLINIFIYFYILEHKIYSVEALLSIDNSSKYIKESLIFDQRTMSINHFFFALSFGLMLYFVISASNYQMFLDIDWYDKGNFLSDHGEYEKAIQAYDKAIELNPNFLEAWNNKGEALRSIGNHSEAIKAFDRAIDLNSDYAPAWNNKALALWEIDKNSIPINYIEKAISLDPASAHFWYNKGSFLYELGRFDESLQAFNKSLKLDRNCKMCWIGKSITLQSLSRYAEANEALANANKGIWSDTRKFT